MKLQVGYSYLINWGKTISELLILQLTPNAVHATTVPNSINAGAWYFREDIEAKALEQLPRVELA